MAKPKLALIPAAQGTKLYSVLPSDGTGDFDFTRGSVATRINAQGLIENVASGQSRLDYPLIDGVQKGCPHHILEPQRTNIFPYSSAFTNINDFSLTVTDNASISPEGSNNATSIIPNVSNTVHYLSLSNNSTGTVTFSIYAKANGYNYLFLHLYDGSNGRAWFNLENGIIGTTDASISAKIEKMPNGWYRCIITRVLSGNLIQADIAVSDNDNIGSFSGNGNSGLYIFGAMLEQGSFPTSYIPTNGTVVTRSAETATGAGNSTTFNDSEGVLMAEISALADDSINRQITLSDGTDTNRLVLKYDNQSNIIQGFNRVNGSETAFLSASVTDITLFSKCLLKYKLNDYALWINGFELATDTSSTTFPSSTLNDLKFGVVGAGSNFLGKTKQLQYFDSILADTQLEQLTSWQSFRDMAEGQLYTIE